MDFRKLLKIAAGALLAKVAAKGVARVAGKTAAKPSAHTGGRKAAAPKADARELVKKARKAARIAKRIGR